MLFYQQYRIVIKQYNNKQIPFIARNVILPIIPRVRVIIALTSPKYTLTFRTTYMHTMRLSREHYIDVIMGEMVYKIASLPTVYLTVYSDTYQRKHQSSASLAFVRGTHQSPVNSPHKGPG